MSRRIFQVDAFTESVFSGNPAAVCMLDELGDPEWMQRVAAEMNLSETAFVAPGDGGFDLRWFTPTVEVDLCGHATLASAHALWSERFAPAEPIVFRTRSGELICERDGGLIWMDFPARPVTESEPAPGLIEALDVDPVWIGRSGIGYVIELASEVAVRAVAPDFSALGAIEDGWTCVTARASDPDVDFVSRYFAPQAGIDEDPVTGSAHCALGPLWQERLGSDELVGHQVSARGGIVHVRPSGDRVRLGGRAVTVMRGELEA